MTEQRKILSLPDVKQAAKIIPIQPSHSTVKKIVNINKGVRLCDLLGSETRAYFEKIKSEKE